MAIIPLPSFTITVVCFTSIFCLLLPKHATAWKSDPSTPGWFILYAELKAGQISYHIPDRFLYLIKGVLRELPDYQFDGHNSEITIARLEVTAMDLNKRQGADTVKQ